jgi:hypothetical protein
MVNKKLLLLTPLLLTACLHHTWPYIAPYGIQAYYVHHHNCKLIATDPDFSHIYPEHTVDQLWSCGNPDTQFWIFAEEEQP